MSASPIGAPAVGVPIGTPAAVEQVVLLDLNGAPIGTMDKAAVHTADTPLHLAFSCYVFDRDGRMLLTRRSLRKRTWPGVWTNTACGHPAPDEPVEEAVRRRLATELGVTAVALRAALPDFRYRAVAPDGVVENEVCPVYLAEFTGDPAPDPDEVMDWRWVDPAAFARTAVEAPFLLSPWSVLQAKGLLEAGFLA
ncbi:isopentenyl-diphosphate Delta-isomerase [Agromyces fucosus]|uniref:Isopentenyl-diphosphate Delta-isomerase n=1 Tax=Agromyces fucosus TaxID=41985 RepID=A0A4Q2JLR8_9MICO|nr:MULTISPECIES: isopentenyl-diphosphate Delta-isomerase [Agromyces]KQZ11183.1 isopentenyl-diphosphate delta-isomerase [Agromyces sp. Root1464]RXZ49121.1 isopentenyl-diphosphate Delta-isomerase [Agromyces fucosus]